MFPIWKDLSPIEGFYIPYIHLIKCFPLKSYIWPHIGPGRSWRRFLFLSKLVMSPDNSAGKGLFFQHLFPAAAREEEKAPWGSFSSLPCRNETLNFNKKPFQIHLLRNMVVSSCILGLHLPGPVSQMGFFGRIFVPRSSVSPPVPQLSSEPGQCCPAELQFISDRSFELYLPSSVAFAMPLMSGIPSQCNMITIIRGNPSSCDWCPNLNVCRKAESSQNEPKIQLEFINRNAIMRFSPIVALLAI